MDGAAQRGRHRQGAPGDGVVAGEPGHPVGHRHLLAAQIVGAVSHSGGVHRVGDECRAVRAGHRGGEGERAVVQVYAVGDELTHHARCADHAAQRWLYCLSPQ